MKKNGFSLIELLSVIVILGLLALIIIPIMVGVVDKRRGNKRTELANETLEVARYFYNSSVEDENIVYPTDGLEFICNKKACEATIGTVTKEEGIAMLSEEKPITYQLSFKGNIPSSGSIVVEKNGNVIPKNLAIDSHLCKYDETMKVFTSC